MDNLRNNLVSLLTALNTVEVKGAPNVKTMANCMAFVEQMIAKHDEAEKSDKKPKANKEDAKEQA